MAKKRVPMVYSPVDYGNIPSPNIHEAQFNMYGYPDYQKGWNEKEISYPKLLYYDGSSPQKNKQTKAESKTNYEQEKHKNVKSQIKRALSMKKDNSDKETRMHHKPLQKTKSCDAHDGRKEKLNRNHKEKVGFYPVLENMINSYSDNFGYDGRKENLARKYSDNVAKGHPAGYESYPDNYGRKYSENSNMVPSNRPPPRESHENNPAINPVCYIPVAALSPVIPELKKELSLNLPPKVSVGITPSPVKVNPNFKQNVGLPKQSPGGSKAALDASKSSPVVPAASPSRKVPPPVKPKPKKIPDLNVTVEDEKEKASIPKLVDLCESILHKLKSWKEITKEITGLVSQLEALISLLMTMPVNKQRKPSLTESIASALESFSFLGADDDNDSINDATSLPEDNLPSFILQNKTHVTYRAMFHHLSALYDLIVGFQPSSGPLNVREKLYYHKIYQQKMVINQITQIISEGDGLSLKSVCERFCEIGTLSYVWNSCATNNQPWHCTSQKFTEVLNLLCQQVMNGDDNNNDDNYLNTAVCSKVVNELCELGIYKTDIKVITVFQFVGFFKNEVKNQNIKDYLKKSVEEFLMLKVLFSKDDLLVMPTLQQYWKIPVVKSCIQCLLSFIAGDKASRRGASLHALTKLHENPENKSLVLDIIVASLEESNIKIKAGACIALGKLKVQGISKKLIYLFQTDTSLVKEAAENGLKDLGHNLIRR